MHDPDNQPIRAPHGAAGDVHADGSPLEDHRWWRSVVENSSENVTIVDVDGTLRYASPAFGRMLGYDPEEVVGKMNVLDHVHPDDLPHVLEETEKALGRGGITSNKADYRFRHKDGSWRWVESIGTYLLEDPDVKGVVVQTRDVTARKEAEERFRAQYENFPLPTYTWRRVGEDFVLIDHNDAAHKYSQGVADELLGSRSTELFDDWPDYLEMIERCFRERTTLRRQMAWRTLRTGEERRFVVTCVFVSPDLVMVHTEDITERIKTEERLRFQAQLLDAVGEAVIALDMQGRVVYWNRAAQEIYGWSEEEAMGRLLREMVVPEGLREQAGDIAAQLREGRHWSGEFVVGRKDGTTFLVEGTDTPVFDEDGEQIGVVGVLRDVSERKEAEEALRRSEAEVFGILESITDAFFALDKEWRFSYVNRKAEVLFERKREDLIGERLWEDPTFYPHYRKAVAEGVTVRFEGYYLPLKTWYSVRSYPSKSGLSVYLQDITERKKAEEKIRFQSGLLDAVGQAVIATDTEGKVIYWNRCAEDLYGWSAEEVMGRPVKDFAVSENLRGKLTEIMEEIRAGNSWSGEFTVLRKDGGCVPVLVTDTPVYGERGDLIGIIGVTTDLTNHKEAEERLAESERRFSAVVSNAHAFVYRCLNEPGWPNEYASDYALELTGHTPEELLVGGGVRFGDLIVEEDRERVWAEVQEALSERRGFEIRYTIRRKNGEIRHVRDHGQAVRDEDGEVVALEGMVYDVTALVEAEERLKESEERYRSQSKELGLLHQVRTALAGEPDEVGVLYRAVEAVVEAYGYSQVSAYLIEGEELVLQHQVGYEQVIERIPLTEGVSGRVVRGGRPVLVEDVAADPDFLGAVEGVTSEICIPLFDEGTVVGILNVESTGGVRLTQDDLRLMVAVGGHVGVALSRARLHARVRHSEERYRALTQNSSDLVTLVTATGVILYQSVAIKWMLGYFSEELLGKNVFDYVHPNDVQRVEMAFAEGLKLPERRPSVQYRFRHKDGSWVWLESVGTNLLGDPAVGGYVVNSRDVTERKRSEDAVRRSEASLAESQRLAHLGTWEWDVVRDQVWWSDETYRIYGLEPGTFVPTLQKLMEVVHPDDRESLRAAIDDAYRGNRPYDLEHRIVRPDGTERVVHRRAEVVRGDGGDPIRMIGTVHDVTERKKMEERLRRQALHDSLTGLPNRKLFTDRLAHALERTRRTRGRKVAVLFMDLDGFKVINDSLGHEVGDLLLVIVAERLRRLLRPEDTLARFGGDEFVVLIEEVGSPYEAVRVAERITSELKRPFSVEGRELFVAASVGVALGDVRSKTPEDLLRDADTAMYRAKESGTGHNVFDPAMYLKAVGRLELENDLRGAIEREEFVVHYQPIISLDAGEAWGFEALVRWEHPERGLLSPSEFVPVAEESGLVVPMGEAILEEACRQAKEWQEGHPDALPLVMSVNVSAKQLARPTLAKTVERVLDRAGFDPSRLGLDVTESTYVEVLGGDSHALDRLRDMGVRISIDDFGTGYSSLSYLKRLPADILKIDRSFVKGLGEDVEDTAIVRMVIDLAHTLGMKAVAEGVEEGAQAALLKEMGCDFAQGYHFARPLPPEEVPGFLAG